MSPFDFKNPMYCKADFINLCKKAGSFLVQMLRTPQYLFIGTAIYRIKNSKLRHLLYSLVRLGIVRSWRHFSFFESQPSFVHCVLELAPVKGPNGKTYYAQGNNGQGIGQNLDDALRIALSESLERYSQATIPVSKLISGSFLSLNKNGALSPNEFKYYSSGQLDGPEFMQYSIDESTNIDWVEASSFLENDRRLVPAQLVYTLYDRVYVYEPRFRLNSSSGVAAGSTLETAQYRSICEAIERDGFLIYWLNKLSPQRINLEHHSYLSEMIRGVQMQGFEIFVLNITTEIGLPSFACVMLDRSGPHAVAVDAIAGFDVEIIIEKLILSTLRQMRSRDVSDPSAIIYKDPKTIYERSRLWSGVAMIDAIDFFLKGPSVNLEDSFYPYVKHKYSLSEKVEKLRELLLRQNMSCFLVDITHPVADKAGLRVVRAIIPKLVPLFFSEHKKPLGIDRLYSVPVQLGYLKEALKSQDLNSTPHPFL